MSKICLENEHRHCPRCRERRHYRLKDGRRRCARCKYTFHDFSGRWINTGRLGPDQWLRMIRYFIDEFPALKVAGETLLAYNTVANAYHTLRCAILAHAGDAGDFFCHEKGRVKCCYGGKGSCGDQRCSIQDVPVFGLREKGERVEISLAPGVAPGSLMRKELKKRRMGAMVYTNPWRGYDSLLYYGYHHGGVQTQGPLLFENGSTVRGNGFFSWLRKRFPKYYGVSPVNFPLYIKETEFRYNHRHDDLFEVIVRYLCDPMPSAVRNPREPFLKPN